MFYDYTGFMCTGNDDSQNNDTVADPEEDYGHDDNGNDYQD